MLSLPAPILAEVDIGNIVFIVAGLLYGLFWLLRKVAEAKEQQQRMAGRTAEQEQEEEEIYLADEEKVKQFLEGMGAKREPRQPPQQEPAPAQHPGRPPQRPQPRPAPYPVLAPERPPVLTIREEAPRTVHQTLAAPLREEAPLREGEEEEYHFGGAGPLRRRAASLRDQPPQLREEEEEEEEYHFGGTGPLRRLATAPLRAQPAPEPATAVSSARRGARTSDATVDRLAFAQLSPLQRAIILSEILDRGRGPHNLLRRQAL